jgi:hypothetical protein
MTNQTSSEHIQSAEEYFSAMTNIAPQPKTALEIVVDDIPEENTSEPSLEAAISNSDRLLRHLKPRTLAAQLVQAHKDAPDSLDGLKKVLTEHLDQVRRDLGAIKD